MSGGPRRDDAGAEPPDAPVPVRVAATPAEREAIYRLRYDVFVDELGKGYLHDVDHARRRVHDGEDDEDGSVLFYAGTPERMVGSARVRAWPPGGAPADVATRYSLDLFPGIGDLAISEVGRLVVHPAARGRLVTAALAGEVFRHLVDCRGVLVGFAYCAPGLVRAFQRLGFRPYGGRVIANEDGIRLPMVLVAPDLRYFESVGSPLAPLVAERFPDDGGAHARVRALLDAVASMTPHYEVDPARVWREIQDDLLCDGERRPVLLDGLDDDDVRELGGMGLTMEVPAGRTVMREGLVEKELFLVLEGSFEGCADDRRIAVLSAGDVFGEVSFFLDPGRRRFTVRALTAGRLMVFRHGFVDDLMRERPRLASRLLFNLGRILAARVAATLRAGHGAQR